MSLSHAEYKLLPQLSVHGDSRNDDPPVQSSRLVSKIRTLRCLLAVQSIALLAVLLYLVQHRESGPSTCPQLLYSPVQDEIVYESKMFFKGQNRSSSVYSNDPSDQVDQAWHDLYARFEVLQIPKDDAMRLPNKTIPVAADPSQYIISVSVFHQLHCLDILRKVIHSDYYADPVTGDIGLLLHEEIPDHVGHCLDFLRQGVMCAADVSPMIWYWREDRQAMSLELGAAHTCRRWENIDQWARAHILRYRFDMSHHVEAGP
ncbi:hypothetical protein NM688_g3950 [Phlebia brevispora]|uniref:Uncharacterized protein n=1 Tax=Phlebia brevispora TaxID=194682 RepID=A0ACC1T4Y0_9APHY|nr:hypothetical protein NM688_g3950 [Phlebia brevispora]